jgi:hypothetical protein
MHDVGSTHSAGNIVTRDGLLRKHAVLQLWIEDRVQQAVGKPSFRQASVRCCAGCACYFKLVLHHTIHC